MSFNARIKSKRDTASNWETNNPVLLNGELIIVDTNAGDVRFKIGDGVKTYTQLPFQDESLYNVLSTKADSADLESIQASIVQSDLSQTDNTSNNYVKGIIRQESLPEGYPYKEDTGTILDGTFEFTNAGVAYGHQITDENFTITPGRSYTVIWDGETYQCIAATVNGNTAFGNLAIDGATPNTGEPFLFVYQSNSQKFIFTNDTAATHTIVVNEEIVHTIASEFLPGGMKDAIDEKMSLVVINAQMPSSDYWISVTYGNWKFVAIRNSSDQAAYSEDGISWTSSTMPSSSQWESVTYGNGKFVAVAYNSDQAAYSEDGINWTSSTMPSSGTWRFVTYGNGKFVAIATTSAQAAYSEDGINWTLSTMPSSDWWISVTYGNGKFVAIASGSRNAAYSEDGINWTVSSMPSSRDWEFVTYGNGKFVAIVYGSRNAAYSEDGINWASSTMPSSGSWKSVTYGNGKFVAIASCSSTAAYSEDGINWTSSTMPNSVYEWLSVTYGNGKFVVVVRNSDLVVYSEDGITWKTELKLINQNGKDVTADTLIALEHTHEASKISAGTFAGQVVANSNAQTPGTSLLRNSKLVSAEETPTVNGEICWVYS